MAATILEVKNLHKSFGGVQAIRDLSFSVSAGEVMGLIGPNGSGKSTTVNSLAGLFAATSGEILLGGEAIQNLPEYPRVAKGLTRTFQTASVFPEFTVREQVRLGSNTTLKSNPLASVFRLGSSSHEPDAILVVGYVEPAAFIYRQSVELGIDVPRFGFTSGSEEQFLRVANSDQMEGVWDLRPTELTLLSATDNGIAYHENFTQKFGIAPSPSSPYAYDQTYALKDALEAAGDVDDTEAVAAALRELPVPDEVVMEYLPVDGKMFDQNGQAYTSNGAFQWQSDHWVYVEDLPSDPAAYSAFLSTID